MKLFISSLAVVSAKFTNTVISTPTAPSALGPYSQGILSTNEKGEAIAYVAGQIGLVPSTGELIEGGIHAETEQLMDNIMNILHSVGAKMEDILECNCLMADLGEYDAFNKVYATYFFDEEAPARAAYQVTTLPKNARAEVKCTAHFNLGGEALIQ